MSLLSIRKFYICTHRASFLNVHTLNSHQKKVPVMHTTTVVIPVDSAMSHSTLTTTSAAASTITPTPISTPAPTSSASLAVIQDSAAVPSKQSSTNGPQALPEKVTLYPLADPLFFILPLLSCTFCPFFT